MKNVVITGATSGIGKSLVDLFSKEYNVFASYRNEGLIENKENVHYFYMNLLEKSSIINASEYIKSQIDRVDILINVAGGVVAGPIEYISCDKIREQFELNTFSHLEFAQNISEIMENSRIINVSSMASFGFFPFIGPYCASKRALDILFNAFAVENHKNIQVISIKPGVISTPLWEKSINKNSDIINNCPGYEKEMIFMKNNALKNIEKGLPMEEVSKLIYKVAKVKNPNSSYTVGKDAMIASIFSFCSQSFINKIIKIGLKIRIGRNKELI